VRVPELLSREAEGGCGVSQETLISLRRIERHVVAGEESE
jgi:hypothetical protein